MEKSHDIILMIIIGAIMFIQVYVFVNNYRKIQNYKNTIRKSKDFEIVEVAVPEEWIKEIEVNEILKDPATFRKSVEAYSTANAKIANEEESILSDDLSEAIKFPEDDDQSEEKMLDYEVTEEHTDDDEIEYDGPFKSFRNKLKNLLE